MRKLPLWCHENSLFPLLTEAEVLASVTEGMENAAKAGVRQPVLSEFERQWRKPLRTFMCT
jgi:hypothetical protein